MASLLLYSTNPWFASDLAMRYRGGIHFAWVSEYFDTDTAPTGSAAALIAPSSNPSEIYRRLFKDWNGCDAHSALIKGYKKTFRRLARQWLSASELTKDQHDEIIASVNSPTWTLWRPTLYLIPREPIEKAGRIVSVARRDRAAYGPELQVRDLRREEFDIIQWMVT